MGHGFESNKDTMFSSGGQVPWHGLGTVVEDQAVTAADALRLGGLDWEVECEPIYLESGLMIPNRFATVRQDTKEPLGVVGSGYEVLQNHECFGFFDRIVDAGEAIYHTAGSIWSGRRVWILAKLPDSLVIGNPKYADVVDKYILVTNTHDGSAAAVATLSPVRVVCQNTLSAALHGSKKDSFYIRHTKGVANNVKQAAELMGLANDFYLEWEEIAQRMAGFKVTDEQAREYLLKVLKMKSPLIDRGSESEETEVEAEEERLPKRLNALLELYEEGRGAEFARGTLWGAYNAVTEFADHKEYKSQDVAVYNTLWAGDQQLLKRRAFKEAKELVKV